MVIFCTYYVFFFLFLFLFIHFFCTAITADFSMRALKFYSTALFHSLIIKLTFTSAGREASKSGAYYGYCAQCLNLFLDRGGDGYWS